MKYLEIHHLIWYILVIVFTTFQFIMFSTRDYILEFVNSTTDSTGEQDGANYRLLEYKLDMWLCNVTKYVFGEFPATIYIRV